MSQNTYSLAILASQIGYIWETGCGTFGTAIGLVVPFLLRRLLGEF